jgi:predicted MPP superfamily phosphohydrolase
MDDSLPLILLDHQPAHLEQAEEAGVSLQLSGHTHAGQIFPLNIVNRWIWELNWGSLKKGATQYYVSSGVGTWGPPVRTGSWPEIVRIRLVFDQAE